MLVVSFLFSFLIRVFSTSFFDTLFVGGGVSTSSHLLCANFVVNSVINVCKKNTDTHTCIYIINRLCIAQRTKNDAQNKRTLACDWYNCFMYVCSLVLFCCFSLCFLSFNTVFACRRRRCCPHSLRFYFFLPLSLFFLALMCVVVNRRVKVGKELALFVELWWFFSRIRLMSDYTNYLTVCLLTRLFFTQIYFRIGLFAVLLHSSMCFYFFCCRWWVDESVLGGKSEFVCWIEV